MPAGIKKKHMALGGGTRICHRGSGGAEGREARGDPAHHGARGDGGLSTPRRPGQPLAKMFYSEILELGTTEV